MRSAYLCEAGEQLRWPVGVGSWWELTDGVSLGGPGRVLREFSVASAGLAWA